MLVWAGLCLQLAPGDACQWLPPNLMLSQLPTPCTCSTKTRKERAGDPAFSTVRQPVGWHWAGLNPCIRHALSRRGQRSPAVRSTCACRRRPATSQLVEVESRNRWRVHMRVARSVDDILAGRWGLLQTSLLLKADAFAVRSMCGDLAGRWVPRERCTWRQAADWCSPLLLNPILPQPHLHAGPPATLQAAHHAAALGGA